MNISCRNFISLMETEGNNCLRIRLLVGEVVDSRQSFQGLRGSEVVAAGRGQHTWKSLSSAYAK